MLFYRRVVPIEAAEKHAQMMMKGFDNLPPAARFACNCAPEWPHKAQALVDLHGDDGAAARILREKDTYVFKIGGRIHP